MWWLCNYSHSRKYCHFPGFQRKDAACGKDALKEAYLLWKDYKLFKIQLEFNQLTQEEYRLVKFPIF